MISQIDTDFGAVLTNRGRVLLVDDDAALLELGLRVLGEAGFEVRGVASAQACLEVLREEVPDLLLLDIHLPDVCGLEFCTRLKSDPATAGLTIVHLSGDRLSCEEQAEALESGADGYLARPLSNDDLVARVHAMLRVKRTETELRRVTGELRTANHLVEQSEQRYKSLFEHHPDAVCSLDLEGRFLSFNPACEALTGYPPGELLHAPFQCLLPPEDHARAGQLFVRTAGGEPTTCELPLIRRDGVRRLAKITSLPIKVDERIVGVFSIAQDITEQKHIEAQSFRAQRMESIGTLAGGIAHDLNNTLSPILMAIELLRLTGADPANREVLDTIEASVRRGAEMVKRVLSFARGVEGERVVVQPRPLLDDIQKIATETFPKNIEVRLAATPDLWNLLGNPTQLHQVLLNLCVNARDAMPGGGRLSISAENAVLDEHYAAMNPEAKAGPHVIIAVQDTGTGIPAALLEKIFEPFFTTKEVGLGTGLGLSSSLAIVRSHGGFIRVSSESGEGAIFQVHLPADAGAMPPPVEEDPQSLPRGHGEWIMVVDDEEPIRAITQLTLEAFGYRVFTAADGIEAVALYAQQMGKIAAVISDMMMPGMDGPAMIEVLRRMNPDVRVIVMSGLSENQSYAQGAKPCVKEFLPKPYTAERLLQTLVHILSGEPAPGK